MNDSETVRESQPTIPSVTPVSAIDIKQLRDVLADFDLAVSEIALDAPIPGSFWGDAEAGLAGDTLRVRPDTPVHSALHEAGHYICMEPGRRAVLDTDAGGDYDEENAVCYWQIMICDRIHGIDRAAMCADMDAWGYTFRLGSAAVWFAEDAEDARAWLVAAGLLDDAADQLICGVRQR